jgi:hypothetical protein
VHCRVVVVHPALQLLLIEYLPFLRGHSCCRIDRL